MSTRQRILTFLLRFAGAMMLLALATILLPVSWMAAAHRWLGLGPFPSAPLVDYLTRSASALYALHGGLYLVASRDLRRFRPVIRYIAWVNVGFGAVMLGIDLHAGMPWYWTISEGPPVVGFGLLLLYLLRSVPRQPGATPA